MLGESICPTDLCWLYHVISWFLVDSRLFIHKTPIMKRSGTSRYIGVLTVYRPGLSSCRKKTMRFFFTGIGVQNGVCAAASMRPATTELHPMTESVDQPVTPMKLVQAVRSLGCGEGGPHQRSLRAKKEPSSIRDQTLPPTMLTWNSWTPQKTPKSEYHTQVCPLACVFWLGGSKSSSSAPNLGTAVTGSRSSRSSARCSSRLSLALDVEEPEGTNTPKATQRQLLVAIGDLPRLERWCVAVFVWCVVVRGRGWMGRTVEQVTGLWGETQDVSPTPNPQPQPQVLQSQWVCSGVHI